MQPVSTEPASPSNEANSVEECILALLRGIQDHAPGAETAEGQEFRAEIAALEQKLAAKENPRQLVESAIATLRKYTNQANQDLARQKTGLTMAAVELAEALHALPAMQGNAERWNRVEAEIKTISSQDDLEVVKARLCANVAVARAESLQERQKIGNLFSGILEKLDASIRPGEGPELAAPVVDPLTGLPSRAFAEAELTRVHGQSGDYYLALFIVKRLALINARFGYARGDEVLLKVVTHLTQLLPDFKSLFRWAPCTFLAVAPPTMSYKELRSKVQIIEVARMTPVLEWQGRSAMVPVAMDCRIISVKDFGTPSDLFLRLDTLAADT